jgi:hypothetical protein
MIMNVNVNDISGFDATAEEIRHVYAERDRLREENEDLKFTLENKEYAEKQTKQFTEDICAALGVRSDMSTRGSILSEISKLRKEHENLKYAIKKICSALGIEFSTDTTLEYILDTIDDLKSRPLESCLRTHDFRKLCDILGLEPNHTTWLDIFDDVYRLRTENIELSAKVFCQQRAIKQFETELNNTRNDIIKESARRKEWVRKYESERERANSCNELYKKYKALYDADASKREKLSDDLQTYRASYEAVKNDAVKNRSLMDTVASIVGTVGMHNDVTTVGVLNAKKKANHWDILVDGYGEGTIRSMLENIGVDVSGDKGNGLFR